jgi:hypothetical protein
MLRRQSGISLIKVALLMAGLAAAAMAAMFSMRHEKNYFAEGFEKGKAAATAAVPVAESAAPKPAPLRKCVIDGKTVVSNVDCGTSGRPIDIHIPHGVEAPKVPEKRASEDAAATMREKIIEKSAR